MLKEDVGRIAVVEVGLHGITLDDAPADFNHKLCFPPYWSFLELGG